MKLDELANRIRKYALISFLIPLIAINACLLIYKYLGYINQVKGIISYPNLEWNKAEHQYSWDQYNEIKNDSKTYSYKNCPLNRYEIIFTTVDNQTILISLIRPKTDYIVDELKKNDKIKSVTITHHKTDPIHNNLNTFCIKNHKFLYSVIKKLSFLEKVLLKTIQENSSGFVIIKNPYLFGEVSISRTARTFIGLIIFKPLLILGAIALFLYWKNNFNLLNDLRNRGVLEKFSNNFFYFGILSCVFLILHTTFLGLDFDSKLFDKTRRLIIILFIFFELAAQAMLTQNLYRIKEELQKHISIKILKIKIIFVIVLILTTCLAFLYLSLGEPSTAFKHVLEWNYFSILLFYYLLSRMLWMKKA